MDVSTKKLALSSTASKWRQFKYNLAKRFLLPFVDNEEKVRKPPKEYNFISQKDWDSFVGRRESEEFKVIIYLCRITHMYWIIYTALLKFYSMLC